MAKQKKKKKRSKGLSVFVGSLRGFFLALLSIFLVGFLTFCVVGGYFFANAYSTVTGDVVINLTEEKKQQSLTTIIYAYEKDKKGKSREVEYARRHGEENRVWIDLDLQGVPISDEKGFKLTPEMSKYSNIINAYIALEDKRFWEHKGVDWRRLVGVVTKYLGQGASTLTQQLIKNITQEKDVTAVRKYREILTALNMEKNYSKDTIIEAYLNTLYLGRGCYGIRTGAEKYFGKDVSELNLAECAAMAAITKSPNEFDPITKPKNNRNRMEYCLSEMLAQGLITQQQYDEAKAYKLVFTNNPEYKPKTEQPQQKEINNYYVDFIIESVIVDLMEQMEMSKTEATKKVYSGGLKIYAAVDMKAQDELEAVFRERVSFPKGAKKDKYGKLPQASMAIMDYEGRVVAICGGADEKTGNRSLNRAAASWRQPGSTIKPLSVYAPALDKDLITWSTMTKNAAFPYMGMNWPQNNDGSLGSGSSVTIQDAVARSLNTVSARTLKDKLKINPSYSFLEESFGFTKLDPVNDRYLPPLATGGMTYGFSTLEECAAYAVFGNGGWYYEPYCYYKVTDNRGEIMLQTDETTQVVKQSLSAGGADVMCEMLQTVPKSSYYTSGSSSFKKFPVFSKTGTTSKNMDRWFAAGTPYYVGSVWYGYDQPKDLGTMSNPSAIIWMEVMKRVHKGLDSDKEFPKSPGEAVERSFCTRTGKIAGPNCSKEKGWYKTSNIPSTCTSCSAAAPDPETTPGGNAGNDGGNGTIIGGLIDAIIG